jgi:DNA-binding NarL/FixJ family response regulator
VAHPRILIADDHAVYRRGLRSLLESQPGWEVCGEAADGREAVEQTELLEPDIVVLDISMPELSGLEAARQILKVHPAAEILILTMHRSEEVARQVLLAGARGFVLKSDDDDAVIRAVRCLHRHKAFLTQEVTAFVLDRYVENVSQLGGKQLDADPVTPRENEIIQLLGEGKSNKELANTLGVSVKTIETHRANIMRKLHLHSLSELVLYAVRNNIIQP